MILEIYRFTTAEESGDSFAWLVREAVCDTFSSLIWDVRYYECGQFEVYIAATPENIQIFQKGYVIGRSDDTKNYGIIEKIRLETDTENGDYLTISGRFLTSLLSRRIIYPALNFTTETSYEDIVKTAVEKNCIKSGVIPNIKRVIPSLTIGSVFGDCWKRKTKLQVSYENLLEFVYGICQTIGGTVNVSLAQYRADIFDGRFKMRLDLSEGIDKSAQQSDRPITIFSDTYDNLSSYAYENDDETKSNFAFAFGQGEGTARSRVTCYTGDTEPKELERYEIYVDARDLSQEEADEEGNTQKIPSDVYSDMLLSRSMEQLQPSTEFSEAEIVPDSGQLKYGVDYDVGDYITLCFDRYQLRTERIQLVGMIECFDQNGRSLTPEFKSYSSDTTTIGSSTSSSGGSSGTGKDGVSPIITLERKNNGVLIKVKDAEGEKEAFVQDGEDGEPADLTQILAAIENLQESEHIHDNKSVLDTITQAKIDKWDAADTVEITCHITAGTKIATFTVSGVSYDVYAPSSPTAAQIQQWTEAAEKAHTHSNKDVLDATTAPYTVEEKEKLAGLENYVHPTHTAKSSGLYKISVDWTGHVIGATSPTAEDLPDHMHSRYDISDLIKKASFSDEPAWYKFAEYSCIILDKVDYSSAIFSIGFSSAGTQIVSIDAGASDGKPDKDSIYVKIISGPKSTRFGYSISGNTISFYVYSYYKRSMSIMKLGDAWLQRLSFELTDIVKADDSATITELTNRVGLPDLSDKYLPIDGNAVSATKLRTAQALKIGNAIKDFNGAYGVTWTLEEIGAASTSHTHSASDITSGTLAVARGGTGQTTENAAANALINSLTIGTATPTDADYYISQSAGGGTTKTTYHRRPMSALWEYIKSKISSVLGLTASTYSGKAATATQLSDYLTIGGAQQATYILISTVNISTWSHYFGVYAIKSRHTGTGILVVELGCENAAVSFSNVNAQCIYYGSDASSRISENSFQIYVSSDGKKAYVFARCYDYSLVVFRVLHQGGVSISAGASMTSIDTSTYGTKKCGTTIVGTSFSGNSSSATKVQSKVTKPTTQATYYPDFHTGLSDEIKDLLHSGGNRLVLIEGTASTEGLAIHVLGDSTKSGTAGNKTGVMRLYGYSGFYGQFKPATNLSANRTYTLPNKPGTVAMTSDLPSDSGWKSCTLSSFATSGTVQYRTFGKQITIYGESVKLSKNVTSAPNAPQAIAYCDVSFENIKEVYGVGRFGSHTAIVRLTRYMTDNIVEILGMGSTIPSGTTGYFSITGFID